MLTLSLKLCRKTKHTQASFVGCTAVDPANPIDECAAEGEPCPNGNNGEFCCKDGCPRNYCTAKQAPAKIMKMMASEAANENKDAGPEEVSEAPVRVESKIVLQLPVEEVNEALDALSDDEVMSMSMRL